MKEIKDSEFEQLMLEVIEGKKSRVKLAEELQTDWRTLNKKIQLLSMTNPAHGKKMNFELQRKIDELEIQEEEIKQDDKEKRRQQLLQIEKNYNELC